MVRNFLNKISSQMNRNVNRNNDTSDEISILRKLDELKILEAKSLAAYNYSHKDEIIINLNKAEFKVFSQWGDDGIIQFLVDYLEIEHNTFVEFGVENYLESNTRFLMVNNCWKGLVMDGSEDNINQIKQSSLFWQYQIQAKKAFIDTSNINDLLTEYCDNGKLGLLVIDVDGNDYWIWEAINVVFPEVVVIEYNSLFGNERTITIPYHHAFKRSEAHFSHLYYGASLSALTLLAKSKNYVLVACNSNGNNAFFVRKDKLKNLKELCVEKAFRKASFRESRNESGKLSYLNYEDASKSIKGLEVYNVQTGKIEVI